MTRYVLGIDGGGTKTQALIVDEYGNLCGSGLGGPSNYDDIGVEKAQAGIAQAVQASRQQAHLDETPFAAAFLGMAGVVSENDHRIIHDISHNLNLAPEGKVEVDHDCRIALAGGLSGRPGIVLIIGTGSSCYGRNAAGEFWLAGGMGALLGDEGSSYWMGVQAMRTACATHDGRYQSQWVMERVMEHLGLADMRDMMYRTYHIGITRSEIATLAPIVIQAARQGDPICRGLICQGAQDLALCVRAVAERLGFTGGPCELVLVGGLLNAGEIYLGPLRSAILEKVPQCRITLPELPPVVGGCVLALQNLGIRIEGAVAEKLLKISAN